MRRPSSAVLATLLVILAAGACSTTQPDTGGKQTASLTILARANVEEKDCFEIWIDTDVNGVPDLDTGTVQCFAAVGVLSKTTRNVPWSYSIEVSLIPVGATTETLVASSVVPGDSIEDFISVTGYDASPPETSGTRPNDGTTYYVNGKRVSQGSELYIRSLGIDIGQINGVAREVPNILAAPTFEIQIGTGDTVIVRARKQSYAAAPPFLGSPAPLDLNLVIEGRMSIGGVEIDVSGDPVSPTGDKAGFSFSFTKR